MIFHAIMRPWLYYNYIKLPRFRKNPEIWLRSGVRHRFSTKFPTLTIRVATFGNLLLQVEEL